MNKELEKARAESLMGKKVVAKSKQRAELSTKKTESLSGRVVVKKNSVINKATGGRYA